MKLTTKAVMGGNHLGKILHHRPNGLFFVLLYDTKYMAKFITNGPDAANKINEEDLKDAQLLNSEILDVVLHHPLVDPANVRIYEDPYAFLEDVVKNRQKIAGILNFCDDFSDRTPLWTMPGLFEILNLPFSGYSTKALHVSHNKWYSYTVAQQLGIAVPESYFCTKYNADKLEVGQFPLIVKPVNQGGSEGITPRCVVHNPEELQVQVHEMLKTFDELIISEYLPGDEYCVGILHQGDKLIPLTIKVIQFKNFGDTPSIYSFDIKWDHDLLGDRELVLKAFDGDLTVKDQLIRDSIQLFLVMKCKDFARIDWKCDLNGVPKFHDFNENPMYGYDASFLWCLEYSDMTRRDLYNAIIDNLLRSIQYRMVSIGDFWVREDVLTLQWTCDFVQCTGSCCQEGCWLVETDKARVADHLPEIVEYLRERPELPFWSDALDSGKFCDAQPWHEWTLSDDNGDQVWYHAKAVDGKCIFQMTDKRCAVHAWCIDHQVPWESFKFNVCATWPLAFELQNGSWQIRLHSDFYNPEWDDVQCIREEQYPLENHERVPHVVESMKNTIISRIGEKRYNQLYAHVQKNYGHLLHNYEKNHFVRNHIAVSID